MSELDDIRKRTEGHTPGEFSPGCFVKESSPCKCRYIFSEHYMGSIASMSTRMTNPDNDSPPEKEQRANAHLLAAAPDLLRIATEQEAELAEAVRLMSGLIPLSDDWHTCGTDMAEGLCSACVREKEIGDFLARQEAR